MIDPETADTVKNIFQWYIEGLGKSPLAKKLNALGVPSPFKQRFMRDGRERPNHEYASKMSWFWSAQTISTILENSTYLGHITQNKQSQVSYKNCKRIKIDKADWIIVENTHEPIIDQYTLDRVQELMKLRTKSTLTTGNVYLFSGLRRCADCKRAMERVVVKKKNGRTLHTRIACKASGCHDFGSMGRLTPSHASLVTELVERIDVHESRTITTHFKFEDEFEKVKAFAEQEMQELQAVS